MDPCSSPYIARYSSFHVLFHSFISSQPRASQARPHHHGVSSLACEVTTVAGAFAEPVPKNLWVAVLGHVGITLGYICDYTGLLHRGLCRVM